MKSISLLSTAIGSLPHDNSAEAQTLIFNNFPEFPVWTQLVNVNQKEDMLAQFTENIPGIVYDEQECRWYMDQDAENFYEKLEEFFFDYDAIVNEGNLELLEKYAVAGEYSSTIPLLLNKVKELKPAAIKGQIVGPFTYTTSLVNKENVCAYYDDTSREIILKGLTLKALWQVIKYKEASPESTPVIFMDEPSISQYGSTAFITITKEDIISMLTEIADILKQHGAMVGIHCCGKTDWSIITESSVDVLNFDALNFAESLSLYAKDIENFLNKGGYIAWGMVPTLDEEALQTSTLESLAESFEKALSYLTNKGISKELILKQSFLTPTCGAGSLNVELATKAMNLNSALSQELRDKYFSKA